MLTDRYLPMTKNIPSLFQKVIEGTAPEKFTIAHLRGLGFNSSNDNSFIPLLKALGFLTEDGTPTKRYHEYRDKSKSKGIMAQAIRESYGDLFHINEKPTEVNKDEIIGKFKSTFNTSDRVAEQQTRTFYALLKLADLDAISKTKNEFEEVKEISENDKKGGALSVQSEKLNLFNRSFSGLRYNIEIHLPATKDIEVYNAIFKSLREHLINE